MENITESYKCVIRSEPVPGYDPVFCCDGSDCWCMGLPIEPCLCSDECSGLLFGVK